MTKLFFLSFLLLLPAAHAQQSNAPTSAVVPGMVIDSPWALPSQNGMAIVYFHMRRPGFTHDRLIAVSSPQAKEGGIFSVSPESHFTEPMPIEGIHVAEDDTIALMPGGFHLVFAGIQKPLRVGDTMIVRLRFQKTGVMTIAVPVRETAPERTILTPPVIPLSLVAP